MTTILISFERSYVVPHSIKVPSEGLTGSGFMEGGSFGPPGYLMSKKPRPPKPGYLMSKKTSTVTKTYAEQVFGQAKFH